MSEDGANGSEESSPKRVLIVEDDVMIRMLIEDMLGDIGYLAVAQAAKVEEALVAATEADIDIAILDVNLNGSTTGPVAEILAARGTPFIFATGYGEHGLPPAFRDRPTLKKPFQLDGLKRILDSTLKD